MIFAMLPHIFLNSWMKGLSADAPIAPHPVLVPLTMNFREINDFVPQGLACIVHFYRRPLQKKTLPAKE